MLKEYQLKNFKAFADAAPLFIKPITLLYGPNSAGKSSIIQSLMLLKQTLEESEESDVVLLPKGKLVDLGNYREFVHLHQIDRPVSIKVKLDINPEDIRSPEDLGELSDTISRIYRFLYSQLQELPTLSLEIEFSVESIQSDIALHRVKLWLGADTCPIITYEKAGQELKVSELHSQHSFWQYWWKEYELVLPNRVFNQINDTLRYYDIPEINSRNRLNTVKELEAQKISLSKQLEDSQTDLEVIKQKLDQLEQEIKEVDQELMTLRSQQESVIQAIKQDLESRSKKLENLLGFSLDNFFENNQTPENLNDEQLIEFANYELIQKQYIQLQIEHEIEHEIEQKPLKELKAELEVKIKETEQQDIATDNKYQKFSYNLKIIDLLQNFWDHFSDLSFEKILKDYQQIGELSASIQVNNFLPIEERIELPNLEIEDISEAKIDFLMGIYEELEVIQFLLRNTFYSSDLLREFLKQSVYLGPMRDYPQRFYNFSGKSTKKVGKSGAGSSDLLFEDSTFLDKVNDTLATFNIGHKVKIVSFQDRETNELSDFYTIRLEDNFSQTNVSLLDVGFGVSQVLPVIVQSLFARNQTILIEQPEVHIHPRLQTELGDLFIESTKDFGNCFIVETHSEHLMLRLQRRIREGKLSPEDISVVYVDRSEDGAVCLQLRLDNEGDFIDHWPDGFFDEDYKEVIS